jgi:Protein of unknown function (DUF4232)
VCRTAQLAGSLLQPNGAAGTIYYQLTLRNTGKSACFVQGYPGVSFVAGSDGHQVGASATRVPGNVSRVVLQPGQSASSTLGIVDAKNFPPSCGWTNVLGLRVYPPDQTAALFVPHNDVACASTQDVTLKVGPLAAG